MIRFDVLSIFPELFNSYMSVSIPGRAAAKHLFELHCHNLRTWTYDAHHSVDDAPFGGGQGMLMKPAPFFEAFDAMRAIDERNCHIVMFSPCGKKFTQRIAEDLSTKERIVFACAHYEGVDERVYSQADDVLSLGDFILTGAELPCMVVMDSIVRLLPGALGDEMSSQDESFSDTGLLEYAQYTRPQTYRDMQVPAVLLSGNHQEIARWRRLNALERTARWRPDLLATAHITKQEYDFAQTIISNEDLS